jgi:DNA-binding MarR family transcriptional regulator
VTAPVLNPSDGVPEAIRPIECACQTIVDGRRASRALAEWARRFELSEPGFQVLWSLREASVSGIDQTTLAQRLALSPAQISATVEQLAAGGLIIQQAVTGDRRRRLWQLSSSGRAVLSKMLRDAASLRHEAGREAAA